MILLKLRCIFFTIAENSFNFNVCEMIHNLTKDNFCSEDCSIYMAFNNVSPISVIELHQIIKIKEYENSESVYGDLDLCGWCVIQCQNMYNNKSIHKYLYDSQNIPKKNMLMEILLFQYVLMFKEFFYFLTYLQVIDCWLWKHCY